MNFDAIKARCFCLDCRQAVLLNNPRNFFGFNGPGDFVGLLPKGRMDFFAVINFECRRGDRQLTPMETAMGSAAHVPQLQKNLTAFGVDSLGCKLPPFNHGFCVDAGRFIPTIGLF